MVHPTAKEGWEVEGMDQERAALLVVEDTVAPSFVENSDSPAAAGLPFRRWLASLGFKQAKCQRWLRYRNKKIMFFPPDLLVPWSASISKWR